MMARAYGLRPRLWLLFRYIKIQPETMDISTSLWGINTEFVGFISLSLELSFFSLLKGPDEVN